jgi:hypothetical protein
VTDAEFTELVTLLTMVVDVLVGIACVIAGLYVWHVYRHRHEEALFLSRLVRRNLRVSGAAFGIVTYIVLALAGHGLGAPWGGVVISVLVIAMMLGPITDAVLWFRERNPGKNVFQVALSSLRGSK